MHLRGILTLAFCTHLPLHSSPRLLGLFSHFCSHQAHPSSRPISSAQETLALTSLQCAVAREQVSNPWPPRADLRGTPGREGAACAGWGAKRAPWFITNWELGWGSWRLRTLPLPHPHHAQEYLAPSNRRNLLTEAEASSPAFPFPSNYKRKLEVRPFGSTVCPVTVWMTFG